MLRRVLHKLQHLLPEADSGFVILAYHLVEAGTQSPVDIQLALFESQMAGVREIASVLPLDAVIGLLEKGEQPDKTTVVLTFDDAYENFVTTAFPVLERLHLPSTLYVPTDFVGGKAGPPIRGTEDLGAVSWTQLEALAATGLVSIGSHSCSHPDLRRIRPADLSIEISRSKEILEQRLGFQITSFCYPKGLWSPHIEREVSKVYRSAVAAGGRRNSLPRLSLNRLQRVPIRRDLSVPINRLLHSRVWIEEWVANAVRHIV